MNKTKLAFAMLIGIIALNIATVSMSIAWYARGANVAIDAIDIVFDGDRDLKIATKVDGDYVDHLNYSELNPTTKFMPVTSAHSDMWMSEHKEKPVFYDDTKVFSYSGQHYVPATATGGYFSQDLYIMGDDDLYITIDPNKTYIEPNEVYNQTFARQLFNEYQASEDPVKMAITYEEILEALNHVHESMRISILVINDETYDYKIIDPNYNGSETVLGGLLDNDVDNYYDYYFNSSENAYYERLYGDYTGEIIFDEPSTSDSELENPDEPASAFNAKHKAGIKTVNLEQSIENGLEIKKEDILTLEDFEQGHVKYHFPIRSETPTKVVVSIYIEGWDLESINGTMGATFSAGVGFKIEREM